MSDVATVEALASGAPERKRRETFREFWARKFPRRQNRSEVLAPLVTEENARRDDGVVEVVEKAPLTRETFSDASVEEIVAFLKENRTTTPHDGVDETKLGKGTIGIFGKVFTDEESAAYLRLISDTPLDAEGGEEQVAADVALLKAKFVTASAVAEGVVDEAVVTVDEATEAAALLTARKAELLALADRFAIGQKDRGTLAVLATDAALSAEADGALAEALSAFKAQLETVTVAADAGEEASLPLAFDEKAQPAFDALVVALEVSQREASATDDEQAQTLAVEGGTDVVVDSALEAGVVVAPVEGDDHSAEKRSED